MKALTILQPWATLIAIGEKRFETRSWKTNYRGPLAIHAGKSTDYLHLCNEEPFRTALSKVGLLLPLGAVIATTTVACCLSTEEVFARAVSEEIPYQEIDFGCYGFSRCALGLCNTKELPKPIPARGQQGLWNWEGEVDV
ncbi:MAG: ASCH domain-containing protein [Candidatus Aquicultor sp.]|nr:ASCH domain-containing protein [Candidatus Aquicultor sp.]